MYTAHYNSILLSGRVASQAMLSHQSHSEEIYQFYLSCDRLSGKSDVIPIHFRKSTFDSLSILQGCRLTVEGEIRSFNNKSGEGAKLVILVFARSITLDEAPHRNTALLCGAICRPPIYRETPLGREICDIMLAVNRRYQKSDYLPCIAWGCNARMLRDYPVGQTLSFEGRLQSRNYVKLLPEGEVLRTAYEISITNLFYDHFDLSGSMAHSFP